MFYQNKCTVFLKLSTPLDKYVVSFRKVSFHEKEDVNASTTIWKRVMRHYLYIISE